MGSEYSLKESISNSENYLDIIGRVASTLETMDMG